MTFRTERDPLGELKVPADAYYGVQTARARRELSRSAACARRPTSSPRPSSIKKAAAEANRDLGRLDPAIADAIVAAADEILAGQLRDQFVVDVYQAGAGTSHNMNANEVLANRAGEILGEPRGIVRAACTRTITSTWASRPTTCSRRRRGWRCCSGTDRCSRRRARAGRELRRARPPSSATC